MIVGVSTLVLRNSTVDGNRVIARVAATDDNGASGGALELDGAATIENVRDHRQQHDGRALTRNAAADGAIRCSGRAAASVIRDIDDQRQRDPLSSVERDATVQGAGLINNGLLELRLGAGQRQHRARDRAVRLRAGRRNLERSALQPSAGTAATRRHRRDEELRRGEQRPRCSWRRRLYGVADRGDAHSNRGQQAGRLLRLLSVLAVRGRQGHGPSLPGGHAIGFA